MTPQEFEQYLASPNRMQRWEKAISMLLEKGMSTEGLALGHVFRTQMLARRNKTFGKIHDRVCQTPGALGLLWRQCRESTQDESDWCRASWASVVHVWPSEILDVVFEQEKSKKESKKNKAHQAKTAWSTIQHELFFKDVMFFVNLMEILGRAPERLPYAWKDYRMLLTQHVTPPKQKEELEEDRAMYDKLLLTSVILKDRADLVAELIPCFEWHMYEEGLRLIIERGEVTHYRAWKNAMEQQLSKEELHQSWVCNKNLAANWMCLASDWGQADMVQALCEDHPWSVEELEELYERVRENIPQVDHQSCLDVLHSYMEYQKLTQQTQPSKIRTVIKRRL